MASISSTGIFSGLDVNNIVQQLVQVDKQPLVKLQSQATATQSKISALGSIQSKMTSLQEAAQALTKSATWKQSVTQVSQPDAFKIEGNAILPFGFKVDVQNLAKAQAMASAAYFPVGATGRAGTLRFQMGQWQVSPATFSPTVPSTPVDISVSATDTLKDIAAKVNDKGIGITASVLQDASGERLVFRGTSGEKNGFNVSAVDDPGSTGLSTLAQSFSVSQYASNATMNLDGVAINSEDNSFKINGMTITALQTTNAAATFETKNDTTFVKNAISNFVEKYNAVNTEIRKATKNDAGAKSFGALQGDWTVGNMANQLRSSIAGLFPPSTGISIQRDGSLSVDNSKLDASMANMSALQNVFRSGTTQATGVADIVSQVTGSMLTQNGTFKNKLDTYGSILKRNQQSQDRVNERAAQNEVRYLQQYQKLDTTLSRMQGIKSYWDIQSAKNNGG